MQDYYTVTEYAKAVGRDPSQIRRLLIYGKLLGEKLGNQWIIPKDAVYPEDSRIKSGNCRNWRKKSFIINKNPELYTSLHKMCKSIVTIYGVTIDRIVLYGSYARGEETPESDADIAIILKCEPDEQMHNSMIDVVVDCELECGVTISPVQINITHYSEWKKTIPYYKNIDKEGIILWKAA